MRTLTLFLCFLGFSTLVKAQIDSALAVQLQGALNEQVTLQGNHGVSAHLLFQDGRSWSGTAGVDGQGDPMTDSTVFIGASTSKMSIAILLIKLAEESIISLDDTWHKYLPTLDVAFDTTITIRQLLNHTSGIKDYLEVPANWHYVTDDFSRFYTPQYVLENIVSGIPDFPAGTNFNYSNSNYLLAAAIAEAATPNSLLQELKTRVWNPAGMTHTYLGAYEPIHDPRAGVWWNFGGGLTNFSTESDTAMLSFGYGTDNVVTCPTDLARLVHALLSGQLLGPQSMEEMLTFVPYSYVNTWTGPYGLGIHHLFGQSVDTLLGHDGKFCNLSDVFHSQMCGFTLAVMTNTETVFEAIYNRLYDILRNYNHCNVVPVANFYTSMSTACQGTAITLVDSSTNIHPTSWQWGFPGGILAQGSSDTDSVVQVIYDTPGTYDVTLMASTEWGSSTITKKDYITVNSNVPVYVTTFSEGFETATLPNSDWSLVNTGGLDWSITSNGAAAGSRSIYLDNFSNTAGNASELESAPYDLSRFTDPTLTFKLAYQQKDSSDFDKFQVLTSTNCGYSWIRRWIRAGQALATVSPPGSSPFIPTPEQFVTYSVNIGSVANSQNVRFRFEFTAGPEGPGNNIFLDDIVVNDAAFGVPSTDAGMELSVYPNPTYGKVHLQSRQSIDEVRVTNVLGQMIYQDYPNDREYTAVIGAEGIYMVSVRSGGRWENSKVIVEGK